MNSTEMQYRAFLVVVAAALLVALAPIAVAGLRGESLPEALIVIADKSITAFGTLLGTIGALLFRQNHTDEQRVNNTGEMIATIREAQRQGGGVTGETITDGDTVTIQKDE